MTLSPFAMVVRDRAVEVAYDRIYSGLAWAERSESGHREAEDGMTVNDVLAALDLLLGEFVAGVVAAQHSEPPSARSDHG